MQPSFVGKGENDSERGGHRENEKRGARFTGAPVYRTRGRDLYTGQRKGDRSTRGLVFKDFLDWYSNDFYPLVLTDLIHSHSGRRKLAFYEPPSPERDNGGPR